jgi:ABC-type transport system involved in Fe-S cluster assembly fused permease/ATPase subunit
MSEIQIGDKEKISILAMEYSSLRSDVNARMSSMFQLSAVFFGVAALMFQQSFGVRVVVITALALVAFLIGLGLLWHDIVKAGRRVQQLEAEINRRASEKLLVWETELGGLSHGYWP